MKEDFVPFEIAKKLKEKGFRYNTSYWYNQYGTLLDKDENDRKCKNSVLTNDKSYGVDAPTIAQVLKWLREEKRLHIDIAIWKGKYIAMIVFVDKPDQNIEHNNETIWEDESGFDTYEQAALLGTEYTLDNLI